MLWAVLLTILNTLISWWNAYAAGRAYSDTRQMGGFAHAVTWAAIVMAASGCTYSVLTVLATCAGAGGLLPPAAVKAALELGYVVFILPVLGSGLVIWVDSVRTAWREKSFGSVGAAAWNTYAQASNMYDAARGLGGILDDLGGFFKGGDDDDAAGRIVLVVVALVLVALAGGLVLTKLAFASGRRAAAAALRESCQARDRVPA